MTREEAIDVYNGLLNQKIKEAFEFFAPELAESEDEKIKEKILECVSLAGTLNDVEKVRAYLEKQKEQKPSISCGHENDTEWGEEDEDKIENIIWSLECLKDWIRKYDTDAEHNPSFGKIDKEISWLKSLRPQPRWKPSEEQMKAFEQWLIDDKYKGNSRYVYPIFESLYEDLKKL